MTDAFKTLQIVADTSQSSERLDKFLAQLPELTSRTRALNLIDAGLVSVNSKVQKASYKVQAGDDIEVKIPIENTESSLQPLDYKLDIVFEDKHLIVVNKPSGLVVHPAAGHKNDTLVNALLHHTDDLSVGFDEERPGIVHRLDKDTSGLIVIAKTDEALNGLAAQFKDRKIHRIYWALCFGVPKLKTGKITTNLARHAVDRKKFASVKMGGKLAITNYEVLEEYNKEASLLRLKLETGRTHQIRVHLSEMAHPILGDALYGSNSRIRGLKNAALKKTIGEMERFALHAAELGFEHPITREVCKFKVSWPDNLNPIIDFLGVKLK